MGQSLILLFIALGSLGGSIFIVYRKIPLLLESSHEKSGIGDFVKQGIKKIPVPQNIKPEQIVRGTLARARAIASRTKIQKAEWLGKLREKTEQHKEDFSKSYWDQLRKKTKKK